MPRLGVVRTNPLLAILIVCTLVIAGACVFYIVTGAPKANEGSIATVKDGPTLFQVLDQVSASVQSAPGGPWGLFSVYGIAAQLPFSPNVLGYPAENHTVNSCGALFNGLTLWNGTIPVFNGTLNSGTAPFWQLAFYSNATNEVLVVTDLLGAVTTFPPESYPGPCTPWNGFPGPQSWVEAINGVSIDSSVAVNAAWNAVASFWPTPDQSFAEIITLGPNIFDSIGYVTGGYLIAFDRCGLTDVAGVQSRLFAAANWSAPSGQAAGELGGGNCAALNSSQGGSGALYELLFTNASEQQSSSTTWITVPYQVALAYATNGTLFGDYDGWGLANWMTDWNLTTPSGVRLPVAGSSCAAWVPSISDCTSNESGWYAVVLSASGEWINSFGVQTRGGVGWSEPVTALVSHQQLVIVFPSPWDVSGDLLNVTSTIASSAVYGSVAL